MSEFLNLVIPARQIHDEEAIRKRLCAALNIEGAELIDWQIVKRSLDARKKNITYNLRINYSLGDDIPANSPEFLPLNRHKAEEVHIIGAGPAGYFAALEAIELGFKPIVWERGKDVRSRRRDLKKIHQDHIVDENSNYCFGEGGAGTYSDGKLYTRSKKRGNTLKVLERLVFFGASSDILVDAHPHIGTNKLPNLIANIRQYIEVCGGKVFFNTSLANFHVVGNRITEIINQHGDTYKINNLILATGHSARDIFFLLEEKGICIESKGFAIGVRVEHPQPLIDRIQYHGQQSCDYLPPAAYSLVTQAVDRGVYSFCMCPGGIVAPCATSKEEVVTNGWSPSKRNNPYANSGIVVEVKRDDVSDKSSLGLLKFQQEVERSCWHAAGETQRVPAQRLVDFIEGRVSDSLPNTSYQPGLVSVNLNEVLPSFVTKNLKEAFKFFGRKMPGYLTNRAVLHAPESRTSSPVRIPRNKDNLRHVELENLYPCGEGAGYAGGIVSAAVDGMRCVQLIKQNRQRKEA